MARKDTVFQMYQRCSFKRSTLSRMLFGCLLPALLPAIAGAQTTIAYDAVAQVGNQHWTGNLGLDFNVNSTIVVTALGAFNANGAAGFVGTVNVQIFNRTTATGVGPVATLSGTVGTLIHGDRFVSVTPFILPPGSYSVVAVGFSATDLNGNITCQGNPDPSCISGNPFILSAEYPGEGSISFVGQGRYDSNATLDYPTLILTGSPTPPSNSFLAGTFQFQAPSFDTPFQVSYAANLNLGESYINITNTGANGASLLGPGFGATQAGNICVNVYAFDPSEEMIACCSCLITPDQTVNLGANADLTVKTLTGVPETSVTVKLLASLNTTTPLGGVPGVYGCTNSAATVVTGAAASGTNTVASFGMAAWSTTLHLGATAGSSVTTETPFIPATLSTGAPGSNNELQSLTGRCAAIIGNASGYGICTSCQAGALGGKKL
jgi:hypothetical protein